jgi:arylsulfatase A
MRSLAPLFLLAALAAPVAALGGAPPERPNILFLLADDLGYGDLGCFGSDRIKTPNLDRLAGEGLKLTACYSGMPVCSPSRAAFLTGRNAYRLGIKDWIPPNTGIYLKTEETTVAELLKGAGYRTAHVGKWHLNSKLDGSEPTPADHGFDHWFATQNNAAPSHQNPTNFARNGRPVGPLGGNSSVLTVDEALRFLESGGEAARKAPFFLNVWFHAPHEPVAVPEEYRREQYPDEPDPRKADYYSSVSLLDREVGRLLRELEARGLRRNTFVFFTSDNGPETLNRYRTADRSHGSPGPLRGMKLHLTEAGYRVPGIVSWPGKSRAGSVAAEPVAAFDLLPTVCELTGIRPPARALDGVSFLPVLRGERLRRPQPLFWQYDRALSRPWTLALRDGDWKLLADAEQERFALYNLAKDTSETTDLAAQEPERVRRLAAVLRRLHAEVNASP